MTTPLFTPRDPGGMATGTGQPWVTLSTWLCSQSGLPAAVAAAGEWVLAMERVGRLAGSVGGAQGRGERVDRFSGCIYPVGRCEQSALFAATGCEQRYGCGLVALACAQSTC